MPQDILTIIFVQKEQIQRPKTSIYAKVLQEKTKAKKGHKDDLKRIRINFM